METSSSFVFVGLGNPGEKYSGTRHNAGFDVLDEFSSRLKISWSNKFKGEFASFENSSTKHFLLKPQTFMNLSGESAGELCHFFKLTPSQCVVITDDLDTPLGQIRIRKQGGSGGHNGLKSLIQHLGTEDFPRLRFGIGRHATIASDQFVLMKVSKLEKEIWNQSVKFAADAMECILREGINKAMNQFNKKEIK